MTPLKIFRKIVKFIRGGGGPLQIVLACILGMTLGLAPGFNLTTVGLVLLIVALNVSIGLAMFSAVVGKLLQLAAAPLLFETGHFLIHGAGLAGLVRWAGDTPVVALLDLLSLGVFFFGSGRALLSMRSPYRQLAYIFLFCGGCVIATAIMIRGYNYSETIRQPYLGFAFLTGDTFVDGRMTVLGLLVSMTQALAMVSCVLVPREFFYLLLRNGKPSGL